MQNNVPQQSDFQVLTFTVRYNSVEDRMILHVVNREGIKQGIYITRRLMDQLVPVFAKHLEEKTPQGVPADLVQSMTQEQVRQQRQEEPPSKTVAVDAQVPHWLCKTIHINKQPAGLAVTLTDDAHFTVQLPLVEADLRTVLDIFRNSYVQASWGLDVFPEWSSPQHTPIQPNSPTLLN